MALLRDSRVPFDQLGSTDLIVDQVYRGGPHKNIKDDPLAALLPRRAGRAGVGNQGGFRFIRRNATPVLVTLFSTAKEVDWPDELDPHTGRYLYFGDNREPGRDLHSTPGNISLIETFDLRHGSRTDRARVAPHLLFESTGEGRDIRFRGLVVPGAPAASANQDLVAVWRTKGGQRFQNYRATFTVLNTPIVTRAWIDAIRDGDTNGTLTPEAWRLWVEQGTYDALLAPPTTIVRSRSQQLPTNASDRSLLATVHQHFGSKAMHHEFERFAAVLWQRSNPNVGRIDVTRPWRDGGRDAIGDFLIGPAVDPVAVEFALEAKCYAPSNSVGVREVSRLISRLRHRQFGVLVTTSYVHEQAYKEVRDDGHPVVIIGGVDLVGLLRAQHYDTPASLRAYLSSEYPTRP